MNGEIEEQIELLEKLIPEWIFRKLAPCGDLLYSSTSFCENAAGVAKMEEPTGVCELIITFLLLIKHKAMLRMKLEVCFLRHDHIKSYLSHLPALHWLCVHYKLPSPLIRKESNLDSVCARLCNVGQDCHRHEYGTRDQNCCHGVMHSALTSIIRLSLGSSLPKNGSVF
ncbi:hypothetical protein CK203_052695 [Vitis vinifera]|uniref:Uncharacterized protein n=1 Tax=Vitis vinifera TaxID=29760 RepID=A0A438GCP4_VITVI|nr:hypothetical protein CK203_052695 [Vitis vinifera]